MDCCAHEGPTAGDARFDLRRVADGVHVAVAAPAYKVNSNTAIICPRYAGTTSDPKAETKAASCS